MDNERHALEQEEIRQQGRQSECSELLGRLRLLGDDHDPEGWPAVKMKDITMLLQMYDGAKVVWAKNDEMIEWNPDGYWLKGELQPDLDTAFYLAGE